MERTESGACTMRFQPKYYKTEKERDELRDFLASEYYDGKTMEELAFETNMSLTNIHYHLKKSNANIRRTTMLRGHIYKMIVNDYPELTITEIARKYKKTRAVVRRILKHSGKYIPYKTNKTCKVLSCKNKHDGRGFCSKHLSRYLAVKKDLENGLTRQQIYKKRPSVSQRFLLEYFPKYSLKKKLNIPFISNLYDAGASLRQIGRIYKVYGHNVAYHLKKHGIEMRSKGGKTYVKWQGKHIPCSAGCGRDAEVKGMCRWCYSAQLSRKYQRNKIWNDMVSEHGVAA